MSLPNPRFSIKHYDEIPDYCLGENILDIGSSDGFGAYHSKHGQYFKDNNYVGVDIQKFDSVWLHIIHSDIFDFETSKTYDTVLMLHVLEHFEIDKWKIIFDKVLKFLKPHGYLVVNIPYQKKSYSHVAESMAHKVGAINEPFLLQFCGFQFFVKHRDNRIIIFRNEKEGILFPILRALYRIVTWHKYSILRTLLLPRYHRIVAIYQKED